MHHEKAKCEQGFENMNREYYHDSAMWDYYAKH